MPELYGQPFKSELRDEIRELKQELWNERKEHRKTRDSLALVRAQSQELQARIDTMKGIIQSALTEVDRDINPAAVQRYIKTRFGHAG